MSATRAARAHIDTSLIREFVRDLVALLPYGGPVPGAFLEYPARFVESCGFELRVCSSGFTGETGDYVIRVGILGGNVEKLTAALHANNTVLKMHGDSPLSREASFHAALVEELPKRGIAIPSSVSWVTSSSEALKASGGERHLPGVSVSSYVEITPEMINAGLIELALTKDPYSFVSSVSASDLARVYRAMYQAALGKT